MRRLNLLFAGLCLVAVNGATANEYQPVGAAARLFSFFVYRGSGAKVHLFTDPSDRKTFLADFPSAPEPMNHIYVSPASESDCVFLLSFKGTSDRSKQDVDVAEAIDFRKLSREYTMTPDGYDGFDLVFQGAAGMHMMTDFPKKGQNISSVLRFNPASATVAREIISDIEFIQKSCPPMERAPY